MGKGRGRGGGALQSRPGHKGIPYLAVFSNKLFSMRFSISENGIIFISSKLYIKTNIFKIHNYINILL